MCLKVSEGDSKFFKISHNDSKCFKILQNASKCFKMPQNALKVPEIALFYTFNCPEGKISYLEAS